MSTEIYFNGNRVRGGKAVARGIFDGVECGDEEIFPDPKSEQLADSWRGGAAKALERQYAALVAQHVKP